VLLQFPSLSVFIPVLDPSRLRARFQHSVISTNSDSSIFPEKPPNTIHFTLAVRTFRKHIAAKLNVNSEGVAFWVP
jgi:hypothetical protein